MHRLACQFRLSPFAKMPPLRVQRCQLAKEFTDDASPSTHDRGHGATRVAEETLILVMQSHDNDCWQSCSERGNADLMFSHQKPTGYSGFREEPSKAPEQCTPAQAAKLFREERLRTLPATGG